MLMIYLTFSTVSALLLCSFLPLAIQKTLHDCMCYLKKTNTEISTHLRQLEAIHFYNKSPDLILISLQYDMKLLAVDIPMASGPDQRLFLVGDEQEYKVGGGLISELRDPIVKAMAAEKEFDYLDEREDAEDEAREREEAERRQQEEEAEALRREEERLREEYEERKRREAENLEKTT